MKSRIFSVLVMLFSLTAFAGNVPQAELDNVNNFIGSLLGDYSQMVDINVTEASRSNSTKLLKAINVEANIMDFAKVDLGLKTKKKHIVISGSISGKAGDIGMEADDILEMATEAQKFVDAINKKGDYKASIEIKGSTDGTSLVFKMKPTAQNEDPSIKKFTFKGYLPNDATQETKISVEGKLRSDAGNVATVRTSVTNIFNSLASEEMPKDEDFEALGKVIAEMFKALEDIEE